jgi:erythromycin esterase
VRHGNVEWAAPLADSSPELSWAPLAALLAVLLAACGEPVTEPRNEDPADPPEVPAAAAAWLDRVGIPFAGASPALSSDDLEPLRDLVGDARIVALGENTHGTRDFFQMKDRVLRFLVEEMGFGAFAIEATWPESNRLDAYVRTGAGDPQTLLSGLYFWTWNTTSVLDMIHWMRAHNEAGGEVGFYGFDMQYPGMALNNVVKYVEAVDPESVAAVTDHVRCLASYGNGPDGRFPNSRYGDQPQAYRTACGASLAEAQIHLLEHRDVYEAASDPRAFAVALQSIKVAIQYHESVEGTQSRDESMAENTVWLSDFLGSDSKLVLWAHNYHVSTQEGAMGRWLRQTFGEDMVVVGFTHAEGQFTAVTQSGSSFVGRTVHTLDPVLNLSYEHHLASAGAPQYFLDLRPRVEASDSTSWLAGPRNTRGIGCCFDPAAPSRYWGIRSLPALYDVIVHFDRTTATQVLPYEPPGVF